MAEHPLAAFGDVWQGARLPPELRSHIHRHILPPLLRCLHAEGVDVFLGLGRIAFTELARIKAELWIAQQRQEAERIPLAPLADPELHRITDRTGAVVAARTHDGIPVATMHARVIDVHPNLQIAMETLCALYGDRVEPARAAGARCRITNLPAAVDVSGRCAFVGGVWVHRAFATTALGRALPRLMRIALSTLDPWEWLIGTEAPHVAKEVGARVYGLKAQKGLISLRLAGAPTIDLSLLLQTRTAADAMLRAPTFADLSRPLA